MPGRDTAPFPGRSSFLFIISGYPPRANGGMERHCQRMAEALGRRGHRVTILTQTSRGFPARRREAKGVEVCRVLRPLAFGPFWGLSYMVQVARWMWRLCARWDAALCYKLYLHSVVAGWVARQLRRPWGNRLANTGEWSDLRTLGEHRFGGWMVRQGLQADVQFALSCEGDRELIDAGVPAQRVYRYINFVDTKRFHAVQKARERVVLFVGRFVRQKNLPLLLRAFERVAEKHSDVRLRLVGDGELRNALETRSRRSRFADRIEILGWSNDPAGEYQRASVVVLPSHAEGMSNVMLEAMACGTPVVASDVSGVRDVLDSSKSMPTAMREGAFYEGQGGFVFNSGDGVALTRALDRLMGDGETWGRLSRLASRQIASRYDETNAVESFLNAWDDARSRRNR